MRHAFLAGVGGLMVSGLLVAQSWAGTFKSDLVCSNNSGVGTVSITARGNVKGSVPLDAPLTGEAKLDCEILCGGFVHAGPAPCVDAQAGATTLPIRAPGLGTALGGTCDYPAVRVVGFCTPVYIPPGP
jgi:hypothetical protein